MPTSLFIAALVLAVALPILAQEDEPAPDLDRISTLDNGTVRLGINLGLGGAITHLSKSGSDENIINSADWGRQIQMSHYCGPVPFEPNGKTPTPIWAGLGWNPIQSGDCFGNRSTVLEHRNDGTEMYVKCIPMQWPLDNEPGECTFECWLTLEGNTVRVRSRMVNARTDKTWYASRGQELPAVYTNAPWYRLFTYTGDKPFTGDALKNIPVDFPWKAWAATENWAALVNEADFGLGVYHPGVYQFIGGFAGQPGVGGPKDAPTGYIAPLHEENIDWNIDYDYRYVLVVGSLEEIRKTIYALAPKPAPPSWRFERDRQHWHYGNAKDTGWPIQGELNVQLDGSDPMLFSPPFACEAADAPTLYIEAAVQTDQPRGQVFWSRSDVEGLVEERSVSFDLSPDGEFHVYEVRLAESPEYKGTITGLRFDPTPGGSANGTVRVRSIGFVRPGEG